MTATFIVLAVLSIWDYPARFPEHERLRAEFVQASHTGDSEKMESSSRKGTELLPDDPTWAYNLAPPSAAISWPVAQRYRPTSPR